MTQEVTIDSMRKATKLDDAIELHGRHSTVFNATLLLAVATDYHSDEMLGSDGFHANVDDVLTTLMEDQRQKEGRKNPFVLIVPAGDTGADVYGLILKDMYDAWNQGEYAEECPDLFALLYHNGGAVVRKNSWAEVLSGLEAVHGEIVDVQGCVAY